MKVEKRNRITRWSEASAIKCEFCGDVYLENSDEIKTLFDLGDVGAKDITPVKVCDYCVQKDPEPKYPENLRPPQE